MTLVFNICKRVRSSKISQHYFTESTPLNARAARGSIISLYNVEAHSKWILNDKQVIIHTTKRLVLKQWLFFQKFSGVAFTFVVPWYEKMVHKESDFSSFTQKKTPHKNKDKQETTFGVSRTSLILTLFWKKIAVKILAKAAVRFLQRGYVLSWKRPRTSLPPLLHPWNAISSCCGNLPIDTLFIHTAKLLALSWQGILFYRKTAVISLMTCYVSLQEKRGYCLMTHEHETLKTL